jgi:ectoine hydroxylase-related dioxygenase (phytanoyl-CoA dioxygenase family)
MLLQDESSLITQTDIAFYKTNGYLLPDEPLFPNDKFFRLQAIFEEILANKEEGLRADLLDTSHFYDERLFEFLLDEHVLDIVESILGTDFGLWSSHFICKEPKIGRTTAWHEDSAYWNGRFDNFDGIVTIWLAIDHSKKENGCMKVIPGTHLTDDSQYEDVDPTVNTFPWQIRDVNDSKAVYFELNPNHYSLHDSRIIHGADANQSEWRRCGYTMRYFSQTMKYQDNEQNRKFKIWHCRGNNIHNNPVAN